MSVTPGGTPGNGHSHKPSVSSDGRFVAFYSGASNLVAGDLAMTDVFVRDRQSGTTELMSVSTGGTPGNTNSSEPSISADGRFLAFHSFASNLIVGDTNSTSDVFVRDRQSGTTERVSVATGGAQASGSSDRASISADGRFVAFISLASNLVAGDTNGAYDVFVHDRQNGTTERVSVSSGGTQGNNYSDMTAISADGRFVAFAGLALTLVPGDTNSAEDVFVRDRQNGTTERVSISSAGTQGNSHSYAHSISADGRFVAFESFASNLVAGDTNTTRDVFVRDRLNGTTERVSVGPAGAQANGMSDAPSISADGRFVTFFAEASNLVAGDTNGTADVFLRDRQNGLTERVSLDSAGSQANGYSQYPSISVDGRFVAFGSAATNLFAGDTNNSYDVFLRDRTGPPPPLPFCAGDGSATPCPCGNAGANGHGCANSIDANGAILSGSGNTSLAADTFLLSCGGMPNAAALYFQGTSQLNGGLGNIFGDGLRCANGTIVRLGTKTNIAGASQYPSGADAPVSVRGLVTSTGIRTYQVWYRNAAAFCTVWAYNLSNGLQVQWAP